MKSKALFKNNYEPAKREIYQQLPTLASFENQSLFGLPFKDINLFAIVVLCLIGGQLFYKIPNPKGRSIVSCFLSLLCIWLAAEGEMHKAFWVILFVFIQTCWLFTIKSAKCLRPLSFFSLFFMTTILRFCLDEWLNAQLSLVLMMQLLKLLGAAFDIADTRDDVIENVSHSNGNKSEIPSQSNHTIPIKLAIEKLNSNLLQKKSLLDQSPLPQNFSATSTVIENKQCKPVCPDSFWILLAYTFCHCGLVLGPFFRYRVFLDWLNMDLHWAKQNQLNYQTFKQFSIKVKLLPVLFLLMLANQQLSPLHGLVISNQNKVEPGLDTEQSFVETTIGNNLYSLILNALLAFYFYRARLYFGFLLGEFVCMACGLGAYPTQCASLPAHGPQFEYNPSFSTQNTGHSSAYSTLAKIATDDAKSQSNQKFANSFTLIDYRSIVTCEGLQAEWTGSIRKSLRTWNLPTQYWLARHVYRPMRGYPSWLRLYATLSISALWHGVYSGYFLSFYVLPPLFWFEKPWSQYVSKVHNDAAPVFGAFWILKIFLLSYFGVPFYLLRWSPSILYWSSVYWWGHWVLLLALLYSAILEW